MPKGVYVRSVETLAQAKITHWTKGKKADATKEKLSLAGKGKHNSPLTEFKTGNKRGPVSKATREKISVGRKGIKASEATRRRMAEETLRRWEEGVYKREKGAMPLKQREEIAAALKGRYGGEKNPFFGKKHTEKTREQMVLHHRDMSGENSPWWKGGITPLNHAIRSSFEYRQWRSDVFTRDDFTCQKCGDKGCYLHAHHIKRFATIVEEYKISSTEEALHCVELWNINNGITLCRECHREYPGDGKHGRCDKWPELVGEMP